MININRILLDHKLSFKAKGVLIFCLYNQNDVTITTDYLLNNSLKDGKNSLQSALKELRDMGYATLSMKRNNEGRACGKFYEFYESPIFNYHSNEFKEKHYLNKEINSIFGIHLSALITQLDILFTYNMNEEEDFKHPLSIYYSKNEIISLFPYFSEDQIKRLLNKSIKLDILEKYYYNNNKQYVYYTFTNNFLCEYDHYLKFKLKDKNIFLDNIKQKENKIRDQVEKKRYYTKKAISKLPKWYIDNILIRKGFSKEDITDNLRQIQKDRIKIRRELYNNLKPMYHEERKWNHQT
jgi:hypothetical protein